MAFMSVADVYRNTLVSVPNEGNDDFTDPKHRVSTNNSSSQ